MCSLHLAYTHPFGFPSETKRTSHVCSYVRTVFGRQQASARFCSRRFSFFMWEKPYLALNFSRGAGKKPRGARSCILSFTQHIISIRRTEYLSPLDTWNRMFCLNRRGCFRALEMMDSNSSRHFPKIAISSIRVSSRLLRHSGLSIAHQKYYFFSQCHRIDNSNGLIPELGEHRSPLSFPLPLYITDVVEEFTTKIYSLFATKCLSLFRLCGKYVRYIHIPPICISIQRL